MLLLYETKEKKQILFLSSVLKSKEFHSGSGLVESVDELKRKILLWHVEQLVHTGAAIY